MNVTKWGMNKILCIFFTIRFLNTKNLWFHAQISSIRTKSLLISIYFIELVSLVQTCHKPKTPNEFNKVHTSRHLSHPFSGHKHLRIFATV